MDGHDGPDALIPLPAGVKQPVINGDQGGLPIVGVENIRLEVDVLEHFENRAGEEGEPLRVVVMPVEAGALEIILVVQQIIDDPVVLGLEDAAILPPPGHRHRQAGQEGHIIPQVLGHRLI